MKLEIKHACFIFLKDIILSDFLENFNNELIIINKKNNSIINETFHVETFYLLEMSFIATYFKIFLKR